MTDELYHYGILGMKWGVRRYQNSDGSLTPAGKKKYKKRQTSASEQADAYINSIDSNKIHDLTASLLTTSRLYDAYKSASGKTNKDKLWSVAGKYSRKTSDSIDSIAVPFIEKHASSELSSFINKTYDQSDRSGKYVNGKYYHSFLTRLGDDITYSISTKDNTGLYDEYWTLTTAVTTKLENKLIENNRDLDTVDVHNILDSWMYHADSSSDELYHYGILGMKWGVRRNPQRAYERASKKLSKMSSKIEKSQNKANKLRVKAEAKRYGWFGGEKAANKADFKASRQQYKTNKMMSKAVKWQQHMEKEFSKTSVGSISKEQKELGRRYIEQLSQNSQTARVLRR